MNIKIFFLCLIYSGFSISILSYHLEEAEISSFAQKGEKTKRDDVEEFFNKKQPDLEKGVVITDPLALKNAAQLALHYFKSKKASDLRVINSRVFKDNDLSLSNVKKTLEFIIKLVDQDKHKKTGFRILDSAFLCKNFKFIKWSGDADSAFKNDVKIPENPDKGKIPQGKIRLTNYAIFTFDGNYKKTDKYNCALYEIKDKNFDILERFNYTKQDVVSGVLDVLENKDKVKPLVWLTRDGLEQALMQGSILVKMPDGKQKFFNVYKNNGFSYDKKVKEAILQKRYWYFRQIQPKDFDKKNIINSKHSQVVFAGDIYNIGLGKLIAIKYQNPVSKKEEMRLGVLADAGSALTNNLYQLDLFMGIFDCLQSFKDKIKNLPNAVEAYILVKN